MFRLREGGVEPDPVYPANLKELGYFVTDEGFIKLIEDPRLNFNFYHTTDPRHNEVHREAMHIVTRAEIYSRLEALGIYRYYLPGFSKEPPPSSEYQPHLPILATEADILKTRKRVIVIVNDSRQDLGILAYRLLHRSEGLDGGSVAKLVKEMVKRSTDEHTNKAAQLLAQPGDVHDGGPPGIIVLNTGQQYFSYKRNEAMTITSWQALQQKTRIHGDISIADANKVPGNETPRDHIMYVFKHIIGRKEYVHPDAELYVVGIESGAKDLLMLMNRNENVATTLFPNRTHSAPFPSQIKAMACIQPDTAADVITNPHLASFLRHRTRAWVKPEYDEPAGMPVAKPIQVDGAWVQTEPDSRQKKLSGAAMIWPQNHKISWLEVIAEPETEPKKLGKLRKIASSVQDKVQDKLDILKPKKIVSALSPKKKDATASYGEEADPTKPGSTNALLSSPTEIDPHSLGVLDSPSPSSSNTIRAAGEPSKEPLFSLIDDPSVGDENARPTTGTQPQLPSDERKEELVERPKAPTPSSSKSKGPATASTEGPTTSTGTPLPLGPITEDTGKYLPPVPASEDNPFAASTEGIPFVDPTPRYNANTPFSSYSNPICPTFSGGPGVDDAPADHPECVFPRVFKSVLDFFEEVARNPENYRNPDIPEIVKYFPPAEASGSGAKYPSELDRLAELEHGCLIRDDGSIRDQGGDEGPVGGAAPSGGAPNSGSSIAPWKTQCEGPMTEVAGQKVSEQALKDAGLDVV
ncbi:uncharacterized protein BDZ99DRAFT_454313 [Mytilinidion resinicola]|uniref:Arb2 domain-containing protein n=1 Tax=Mytilinidion resinicola TaxID=574789 RepID=A0A6A6Y311_9PEZI|nr:uncharacterized protein BDZ99DRAFT_454313 [Mytilinidion resinicola]KAF2803029.1 hypothetical protein BDZ99DRAFT_454313 [Mytilinidion resinicola]